MTRVERKARTKVEAAQIWAMLAKMDWQNWDPDVASIENVQGGLVEAGRFIYVLNNGLKLHTVFSDVSEPHGFTWSGSAYAGLLGFWGRLDFETHSDGTLITYAFAMTRPLGWIAHWRLKDQVIHGVEEGLRGIIRQVGG
ncbi:MAG: SRPBCC family protein [Pseudomonadota bacterium]